MSNAFFHDVGNLFPGEVTVAQVSPRTLVGEALKLMRERRYSQLPVVENGETLGVFSLWSLAEKLALFPNIKVQRVLQEMEVGELMEQLPRVTVKDSLHSILSQLELHDALLVDSPHGLQAVATASDVLRYFYHVARPFILLQEIELALRALIDVCTRGAKLEDCIDRALSKSYQARGKVPPTGFKEMTFEDYRAIITCSDNWPTFEGTFGHNRDLMSAKLERLRIIRNEVFHFRSDITVFDYQHLAASRDELLGKLRRAAAGREAANV